MTSMVMSPILYILSMSKKNQADNDGNKWVLYIIECESGALYTGISTDAKRRFFEHSSKTKKAAKFFRTQVPKSIVYTEYFEDRSKASKREYCIKRLKSYQKRKLILSKEN